MTNRRKFSFDRSFSVGDVLTILGMVGAVVSAFYALSGRVDGLAAHVGDLQSQVGETNARLDGMARK